MNQRPTGVVLAAIVLGFVSLALLVFAAIFGFTAAFAGNIHPDAQVPGAPPTNVLAAMMAAFALIMVALAAWGIATVVGLLRMRSWARISIMVIGGLLAALSLMSALSSMAMPTLMKSTPMPPNAHIDPEHLRMVFMVVAIFWLIVAAIGIWWLVYFALRRTRECFLLARPEIPPGAIAMNSARSAPGPMTDFSVAQPLAPGDLPEEHPHPIVVATPGENAIVPAHPTGPARRPVSMTVIAVLLLIGAVCALADLAIPVPLFFFGITVTGRAAHMTLVVLALFDLAAGIGLLRLQLWGWWLAFTMCALGLVNSLGFLLPSYRARFFDYMQAVHQSLPMGGTPVFDSHGTALLNGIGVAFGGFVCLILLALLLRAHWAYAGKPNPTPNP